MRVSIRNEIFIYHNFSTVNSRKHGLNLKCHSGFKLSQDSSKLPLSISFIPYRCNLSSFYRPSFDKPDYVCSLPGNSGLSKCDKSHFDQSDVNENECHYNFSLPINSSCWNKFYTSCRASGENIYWGSISFDNIAIATVAIFQVGL